MRYLATVALVAACLSGPILADAPQVSIRPQLRPLTAPAETTLAAKAAALDAAILSATQRPKVRPAPERTPGDQAEALLTALVLVDVEPAPGQRLSSLRPRARPGIPVVPIALTTRMPLLLSVPRPVPRPALVPRQDAGPERIETVAAVRILPGKSAITGRKGSVCGDPAIKGETLAPITSRVRGCGIDNPVRVTSVDGVALNQSAVIDCDTASALKTWITQGLKPAFGRKEVVGLRIAASYSCRTRNNVKGAPISEHGRGKALDIASIQLANGSTVTVAEDWRRSAGKPMKKAYRAACGTFGTTLGPDANRYHRDHLHFDTARQRGGAYCR